MMEATFGYLYMPRAWCVHQSSALNPLAREANGQAS